MVNKKLCIMGDNFNYSTGNSKVIKKLIMGLKKLNVYDLYHMAIGPDGVENKQEGIKVLPIEENGFDDNGVFKFLNKVTNYIKREKFDYLIFLGDSINYQKRGIGKINMQLISPKTKLIFWETVDSNVRLCMEQGYMMNNVRTEIYNTCNNVVTTSEYGKKVLENEFIKVDKVIWEFAETEKFIPVSLEKKNEIRARYRFKKDDFIFLMVGRNIRRKNHELAIDALYPLLMKYDNMRVFCLIPDYYRDDDNDLLDFCKRIMVNKYKRDLYDEQKIVFCTKDNQPIKLMQGIDDEEVIAMHQMCDAVISSTSNEGYNLNYGECLSTGKPYVGIGNTTLPELSDNGKYAYMCPPSFKFNLVSGLEIESCNSHELREYAEQCYNDWNFNYEKQSEIEKLIQEGNLIKIKIQGLTEKDEALELELQNIIAKIKELDVEKDKLHLHFYKKLEPKRAELRKYIEDVMPVGKCVAEWHKFLKLLDKEVQ